MKLIKADHDRWLQIPGLPGPTRRPVDIDREQTGFANLRSLRIYQFDADSEINGHAEEDEVFVVVLAGSVRFTVSDDGSEEGPRSFQLAAVQNRKGDPCVAFLPPHSAYQLIPATDAIVAYARATPTGGRPAAVFTPRTLSDTAGTTVLLEEKAYARRLRLRLVEIQTTQAGASFTPIDDSEAAYEALVHLRISPTEGVATIAMPASELVPLDSWDTLAIAPGERPELHMTDKVSTLVLTVMAV